MQNKPTLKYLKDYQTPNYQAASINLEFEINQKDVSVTSRANYYKESHAKTNELILNGSSQLIEMILDGKTINNYQITDEEIRLTNLPDQFSLTVKTRVDAFNNISCMGLYASHDNLFTQCEPEGFRKITYYQDRPDVMAKFTTTIIADPAKYPVLLSNGNKISEESLPDGKTKVVWEDPFKKPSYLFALVAGKFSKIEDYYQTKSGRKVLLEVYSDENSINQCQHCMESLKRAMAWDEKRFGLEYDLDRYMIVASGDFNMGAMENKGLNIFNTKFVLADSKTATDTDFINVEAVVGHEYFHNWTGNRVTCRDWFQLSLKEGLTVFRDHEFTSDLHSRPVTRIKNINVLRQLQFPEDAGALSHPVRPLSYLEMNNFYTVTVYEKGAEVVRMYQTILGKNGFNHGLKLYIERNDGKAATCEDFCQAMADANGIDLDQFMLWYSQSGTPILKITDFYNHEEEEYNIHISQELPGANDQGSKKPMLIPLEFGFISKDGAVLEFETLSGSIIYPDRNPVMLIKKNEERFKFKIKKEPIPSLLRNFSAPVIISYPYSEEQLITLASYDSDPFVKFESLQTLYKKSISSLYLNGSNNSTIPEPIFNALSNILTDKAADPSMQSLYAILPSFSELSLSLKPVEVLALDNAINSCKKDIANRLQDLWLKLYQINQTGKYDFTESGKRSLKNTALHYLLLSDNAPQYFQLIKKQYEAADNMTDKIAILSAINDSEDSIRNEIFVKFNEEFKAYPLVMDKWFTLQSQTRRKDCLAVVKKLTSHPDFDVENPNKLYALVRGFTANMIHFNTLEGYQFIASEITRINKFNSGVASKIAQGFGIITSLNNKYQLIAHKVLANLLSTPNLSKDVYEVISKIADQTKTHP